MGQQHNSHVANKTDEDITIVLTDNNDRNTTQVIKPGGYINIPTVKGSVTVSAFQKNGKKFATESSASYTNDSDRSFIVKQVNGHMNIVRAKYGSIFEEDLGLQWRYNTINRKHENILINNYKKSYVYVYEKSMFVEYVNKLEQCFHISKHHL